MVQIKKIRQAPDVVEVLFSRGFILLLCLILIPSLSSAQEKFLRFKNQFTGQSTINMDDPLPYQFGLRYIPTLELSGVFNKKHKLDTEISLNGYGDAFFNGLEYDTAEYAVDLYRIWFRYSTPRLEIRAGLQKLSLIHI